MSSFGHFVSIVYLIVSGACTRIEIVTTQREQPGPSYSLSTYICDCKKTRVRTQMSPFLLDKRYQAGNLDTMIGGFENFVRQHEACGCYILILLRGGNTTL